MQLIGQAIRHDTFGKGVVTGCGEHVLTVCFSEGEKRFLYPDAFDKHLTLRDRAMQDQIRSILMEREAAKTAQKQRVQEQRETEHRLRTFRISPHAQAVFDIRPEQRGALFSTWSVSTGTYISGYSKGEPRIPDRLKPNSMCLLTACADGAREEERRIIGAWMVGDDFFGCDCRDGVVEAHPVYRLELPSEEQPRFWPYVTRSPAERRWGRTAMRYCSNQTAKKILFDVKERFEGTVEETRAEAFYQYYCQLNRLPAGRTGEEACD